MRRFLHGAAIFWRGGAVLALLVLGAFIYRAYAVPEIFESDAVVELVSDPSADGLASAADRLRGAVFDPRTVEQLTADVPPVPAHDGDNSTAVERTRRAIDIRPLGDSKFTIVFRGASAVLARRGCDAIIATAGQRLSPVRASAAATTAEEVRQRSRLLEERTRELAAFVAQHPELAGKRSDGSGADNLIGRPGVRPQAPAATAPAPDSVLPILLQQKEKLEERIAAAEKAELGTEETPGKNPNGDSLAQVDRAGLQKMLAQVKAAIAARQTAAQRARALSGENTTETVDPSQPSPVQIEWQRLVQAVVDAQVSPKEGPAPTSLRVVRAASTPSLPIQPNRPLLALLGVTAGLWAGIVWAFLRVALGHHHAHTTQYKPAGLPAFPIDGEPAPAPADSVSAPRLAVAPPPLLDESDVVKEVEAPAVAPAPVAPAPVAPAKPKRDKNAPLPSFPIDPETAKAVDEATSASRVATAKAVPSGDTKPGTPAPPAVTAAVAPAPAPPAPAPPAPALAAPAPVAAAKNAALPSFPIEPESAKAIDAATSGGAREAAKALPTIPKEPPSAPRVDSRPQVTIPKESTSSSHADSLPKVIISAPEAAPLPSFPMDAEPAAAAKPAPAAPAKIVEPTSRTPGPAPVVEPPSRAPAPVAEPPSRAPAPAAVVETTPRPPVGRPVAPPMESGRPVYAVGSSNTPVASPATHTPSPYAAVVAATRTSAPPPPPDPEPRAPAPSSPDIAPKEAQSKETQAKEAQAAEPRRPSRHPSWSSDFGTPLPLPRGGRAREQTPAPIAQKSGTPATPMMAAIEASPIMGIEEGVATAASGKRGVSVHPPSGPPVSIRPGSEPPPDPAAGRGAEPTHAFTAPARQGRRTTQTLGSPVLGSGSPSQFWTPPTGFGSHSMPRPSDAPPAYASIPAPPSVPSQLGPMPTPASEVSTPRRASAPIAQTLPLGSTRSDVTPSPRADIVPPSPEAASTALAIAPPAADRRARPEPLAASSVITDVPKGWSPHPSLSEHESIEELGALRDQLYRLADRDSFVVGVSSGPEMAAFKSGVAARLAWMLAQPGHARILLMEGDFDHPVVHRLMRIDMPLASGFSEQMRKRMNGAKPGPWTMVRCAPTLHVLAEGLVRSPGLLPTVQFAEAVRELRRSYEIIVIDAPSGGMSVDTRALDSVVDGVVLAGDRDLLDRASHWYTKKRLMAVVTAGADAVRSR